ncbi:hypothetical protein B0T26DRAFT_748363 [Lasiosphaeria miniovina]|uniref:Protein kinase domain-containing protein n=1 Tax=Lasiosphaeria miniovina TaxID=1954250 RepID=A0AA40E4R0_9PEZI|nr:uncharacterized protein B0T26DRAFT_748363 [Lasiosphaeria miniovina]KAK0728089.1 hypothetical protein B0T26DRAFT_748363 [Lasiosphaeria miniovina]
MLNIELLHDHRFRMWVSSAVTVSIRFRDFVKVITILVSHDRLNGNTLNIIYKAGLSDQYLPAKHEFSDSAAILTGVRNQVFTLSPTLSQLNCHHFATTQWQFLSPNLGGREYARFDDRCVLPEENPTLTLNSSSLTLEPSLSKSAQYFPASSFSKEGILVLGQIKGITSAVHTLHSPSVENKDENGRYGDLQPENILLFLDEPARYPRGTLRIANAGLARFHQQITSKRVRGTTTTGGSVEYAPPESHKEGDDVKRSRSYDMWSVGCIFLEFAVWTLGGSADFKSFRRDRKNRRARDGDVHRDFPPYYRIAKQGEDWETYEIHLAVKARMAAIRSNRKYPDKTRLNDLVKIIEEGLLNIKEGARYDTETLDHELDKIVSKAENNSYFWAPGVNPDFQLTGPPPAQLPPVDCYRKRDRLSTSC